MIVDKLLRQMLLTQRNSLVPIWSCRRSDTLVSLKLGQNAPMAHGAGGLWAGGRPFTTGRSPLLTIASTPSGSPTKTVPSSSTPAGGAIPPSSRQLSMEMKYGLPHITIPLPSRNENCVFTLKPVTHSIGDFIDMLTTEDAGIDRAVVRNTEGVRIASTTSIQTLLQNGDFDLVINDVPYRVRPPPQPSDPALGGDFAMTDDHMTRVGNVRSLVGQLYEALNVEEHQAAQEQKLVAEIEALREELAPLEKQKAELTQMAERRTNHLTWLGLGMMSVQFGILARLTWWEYSWDIMEPGKTRELLLLVYTKFPIPLTYSTVTGP